MSNIKNDVEEAISKLLNNRNSVTIEHGDIHISLSRENETLRISVSVPNGRGIGDVEKEIERGVGEPISLRGTPEAGAYHGKHDYFSIE